MPMDLFWRQTRTLVERQQIFSYFRRRIVAAIESCQHSAWLPRVCLLLWRIQIGADLSITCMRNALKVLWRIQSSILAVQNSGRRKSRWRGDVRTFRVMYHSRTLGSGRKNARALLLIISNYFSNEHAEHTAILRSKASR